MKMKTVCELTGLTDRAVRYYIEEELLAPDYTENYLGRRSFDFSEADIARLKDICILRKFGFGVAEIREIVTDPTRAGELIVANRARKEETVASEQEVLEVLRGLDTDKPYTLSELAEALSAPAVDTREMPEDKARTPVRRVLKQIAVMAVSALVAVLPIVSLLFWTVYSAQKSAYATFGGWNLLCILLALVPTAVVCLLFLPRRKREGKRRWVRAAALCLCVLYLPCSFVFSIGTLGLSRTTDIRDYRRLDPECLANRYSFYQELFPTWPHYFENENGETVWLDAKYLYWERGGMDYTYDIYAEWPLREEAFDKEVARVTELFEGRADSGAWKVATVEKGDYICLFYYNGTAPFTPVDFHYTYYIFAYDPEHLRVRYILCDSLEDGADQPYYLSLDWGE